MHAELIRSAVEINLTVEMKQILTPEDVAKRLGITPQSLSNWRGQGRGPAYFKLGQTKRARIRYYLEDVVRWEKGLPQVESRTRENAIAEAERVA
jgi:hypothetical protein